MSAKINPSRPPTHRVGRHGFTHDPPAVAAQPHHACGRCGWTCLSVRGAALLFVFGYTPTQWTNDKELMQRET